MFNSQWECNEDSSKNNGISTFMIGTNYEIKIELQNFNDYHTVDKCINAAYQLGKNEALNKIRQMIANTTV